MFIDEAEIIVSSGKGGDGMVHFRREKYVPRGGPDGGEGGRGGDVILEVAKRLNTLSAFRHSRLYKADDGRNGGAKNQTGRSSKPLIILVPPGTLVRDQETGELLGDLVEPGQQLMVCKGGRGGRGNVHFTSSRNQAPRTAEKGEPGEEKKLDLELKLIADVGIVGVPNAGKSSLLAAATNAKPKVADYPFTTLEPNLGVAELDFENSLILADIPGLIEGAHEGVGLGDTFLRHVQRTRVLIHLLDGISEDIMADFSQINSELALFDSDLGSKPQLVVLNKMDIPDVEASWPELEAKLKEMGYQPMAISAVAHTGLKTLLWKAFELLSQTPEPEVVDELPVYRPEEDRRAFTIKRSMDGNGWLVNGAAIERAAAMTFWEHDGSVRRFQRLMEVLGVYDSLRESGVIEGDTIHIGNYVLEWQD
jgi:GTPase